ncbi:ROK family protein [Shouchella clausii]|uniref:ROK family protein n=1 Tax=Shouchella clausii TaxID=79880 RepID=UPI000BA65FB6|nr:ROK family protein [Shouchella clausii]
MAFSEVVGRERKLLKLLAFDIGGTTIKHGVVTDKGDILQKGSDATPASMALLLELLQDIKHRYAADYTLSGAAFSTPGIPNQITGFIDGGSAIPYLHEVPFKPKAQECMQLAVSFENDANCAALGETWLGSARKMKDIIMVVSGSGIGGAIIKNGALHRGANGYGGEFGYMVMNKHGETFSGITSPVELAKRVSAAKRTNIDAVRVFELAEAGDEVARREVDRHFYYLAIGLYNLQFAYDPEAILIGGAISERCDYISRIYEKIDLLITANSMADLRPNLCKCRFGNDANLIGAVAYFNQSFRPKPEVAG